MIDKIGSKALELGFVGIGFSRPARPLYFDEFRTWVNSGRNAGMSWMGRNMDIREDPTRLFSGCRTIISLAYPYPEEKPETEDGFTLARYSTPDQDDYHIRLKEKCSDLSLFLEELFNGSKSRAFTDSAPLLERSFAYSSGMGFIGKNNMLIIPGHGSYVFLSEILITERIAVPDIKPVKDICGSCLKCIDACPTGALKGPRDFDSSKCLSYLTIECSGPVSPYLGRHMNKCILGCDICQEACPHNNKKSGRKCMPAAADILKMSDETFIRVFGKTALSRPGLNKMRTNIKAACFGS